jgi:HEAT repeat protein
VDVSGLVPIGAGVVTNLATQIVTAMPGWTLHRLRGSKEGSALLTVVAESVSQAFADASRDRAADPEWLSAVAGEWESAFTPGVCAQLIAALRGGHEPAEFRAAGLDALQASGADLASLGQTIDVSEFLYALPRRLFDALRTAALAPDGALRDMVGALILQDTLSVVAVSLHEASPREYRADLSDLLQAIEQRAGQEDLPRFVPPGSSITTLTAAIRVRRGVRNESRSQVADEDVYTLPSDVTPGEEPVVDWQDAAEREGRVIVLGDPGMGKSWLLRWETARLARAARAALESGASAEDIEIPVAIRSDELAASTTPNLAESLCAFLVARYAVPQRSQRKLAAQLAEGKFILLLDALDELPDRAARHRLDELLVGWMSGEHARFRLTSRIAGYTGVPAPAVTTALYEIQPLTQSEVSSLIDAWGLQPTSAARLQEHASSATMASLVRIPLLIALLCATAGSDEELPRTTAGIYERLLRRFLAQENRWPQSPEPEATDIDQLVGILAPLAFHFAGQAGGWIDRMPAAQVMAVIRGLGPAYAELDRDAAAVLRDLSVRAGVLVPATSQDDGRNPPYLFLHRTVAEYLVAYHLATLQQTEWLSIVTKHLWFDPQWQPVISMLGATLVHQQRPAEAAFLVGYLLDQAADPFDQALLQAARVASELPDHGILHPEVTSRLAVRLTALIDGDQGWEEAASFLERYLTRLPWDVTAALLRRTDAGARGLWLTTRILAVSRDPRVTTRIISLLDDETGPVGDVFEALRDQEADCYIDEMLQRFADPKQRHLASAVLQSYTTAPRALAAMLSYAANPDPAVRQEALHALKHRSEAEVIAVWRAAVADGDNYVRHLAIAELVKADVPGLTEILVGLIEDSDPVVALSAVSQLLDTGSIPVEEIIRFARHSSPYMRSYAARALSGRSAIPQVTAALIDLTSDSEFSVRFWAADALACHQSDEATAALIGLLDDDAEIAETAAASLRAHDRAGLARLVLDWLGPDPEPARFIAAVAALKGVSAREASSTLLAALVSADAEVRRAAALALTGADDTHIVNALLTCLHDPSPIVREAAVQAMAQAHDPRVVSAVAEALGDAAPGVRTAAVAALQLGDRHPALNARVLSLLTDDTQEVRGAVVRQIEKTTTPSVLRRICESAVNASDLLAIAGKAIRELANHVYSGLSADEQFMVTRRLSAAGAATALIAGDITSGVASSNWVTPGIGRYVSPDLIRDEYLDEILAIFLQGNNMFGNLVYSYVEIPGRHLRRMFNVMVSGWNFKPAEFGVVLFAGMGTPPPDVREIMRITYHMAEVPTPRVWPGAPERI